MAESYLLDAHYDLVTPDGRVVNLDRTEPGHAQAVVEIEGISPAFVGYSLEPQLLSFNLKSTLAQLGLEALLSQIDLNQRSGSARVLVQLMAVDPLGEKMLALVQPGCQIGKLFAADPRRRVRDPDYLLRMLGRSDRWGRPLLSLGGMEGSPQLVFEVIDGRTVAYIGLLEGVIEYDQHIVGLLPTIAAALCDKIPVRHLLYLHQQWLPQAPRLARTGSLLLVKTAPLHIRTVYGHVVNELLPQGFKHTSADLLQPDTMDSGDVYEIYGNSISELGDIPLEFYTLEPHREYVFFSDRDQLQASLEDPKTLFTAFETAPPPPDQAAVFVVKGTQLANLKSPDWVRRGAYMHEFPGPAHGMRQALMVERYIQKQASYPFLRAIEDELITSQGVLLTRYFPSPVLKRMLLSDTVHRLLKGIYFEIPSRQFGEYFSAEDRAMLIDLAKFAIPTHWVDGRSGQILKFIQRPDKDTGLFVPLARVNAFLKATVFGIYGSNFLAGEFEQHLRLLFQGLLQMRETTAHPLLNPETPLALVTGGGPGAMEVGNRVAMELDILSCANIVDFGQKAGAVVNEQRQNPYVEAKMTYRLDKLVERQAEFHLDLPIFLQGGIGTDFELSLEEVARKVGSSPPYPMILFGAADYWRDKISYRYQRNLASGTIRGSEWVSNTLYRVETGQQALEVYRRFFHDELSIGPHHPPAPSGFVQPGGG
jgi:predicted Rossmann-fold nucleotide-binding protein